MLPPMRVLALLTAALLFAACSAGDEATVDPDDRRTPEEVQAESNGADGSGVDPATTPASEALPPLPGSEGICAQVDISALVPLFTEEISFAFTNDLDDGLACNWEGETEALDIDFYFDEEWFSEVVEGDALGAYTELDGFPYLAYDNGLGGIAFLAPNGWTIEIFPYVVVDLEDLASVADAAVAAIGN